MYKTQVGTHAVAVHPIKSSPLLRNLISTHVRSPGSLPDGKVLMLRIGSYVHIYICIYIHIYIHTLHTHAYHEWNDPERVRVCTILSNAAFKSFGPQNIVLNFRVFLYPNHVEQMLQTVCSLNIFAKLAIQKDWDCLSANQVLVPEFTMKDSVTKIIEGRIYKAVEAGRCSFLSK